MEKVYKQMKNYEYVIEASRSWLKIPIADMIHYRDLLVLLIRRDIVSRYKQTILGPLWFVMQPLLTSAVFTIVLAHFAGISTDGLPGMLFYMAGMLGWQYFAQCMQSTSSVFVANAHLFGKVYFPRLIVPLSSVISNMVSFFFQLISFFVVWGWFKFSLADTSYLTINAKWLLLPLLLMHTAVLGLGVGLWLSALTAKYRDFSHLSGFLTQLWMFLSPVMYPMSKVPAKWQFLYILNPMAEVVESYKYIFFGKGVVQAEYIAVSVIVSILILLSGLVFFSKIERNFIDTV